MGYHSGVSTPSQSAKPNSSFSTLDPALRRGGRLSFERRIILLALLSGLPAVVVSILLLWLAGLNARTQLTVDLAVA